MLFGIGKLAFVQFQRYRSSTAMPLMSMPQKFTPQAAQALAATDWHQQDEKTAYDSQLIIFDCNGIDGHLKMWTNERLHAKIKKMIESTISMKDFEEASATLKQMAKHLKPLDYYSESDAKQLAADTLRDNYILLHDRSQSILDVLSEKTDDLHEKWALVELAAENAKKYTETFYKGL